MPISPESRRQRVMTCAAIAFAAAIFGLCAFVQNPASHSNDSIVFWSAARMLGPDLYDAASARAVRGAESSDSARQPYVRPPFYALLLWPLGLLPFRWAYLVWQLLNFSALIGFVWLWRPLAASYFGCALYLPLFWSFGLGQDAPIMLLILAAGTALIARKREGAGGAILALCAIKPHLFMFVPFALLARRRARWSFLAGGTCLYLVSGAIAGWGWPQALVRASLENDATAHPNLLGVAGFWPVPLWLLVVAWAILGFAVERIAARCAIERSMAVAAALGIVFAPRSLIYDGALFLPLIFGSAPALASIIGVALATVIGPAAIIARLTSLGLAAYALIEARREIEVPAQPDLSVDVITPARGHQGETSA